MNGVNKLPLIVIVVSILASFYFYQSASSIESETYSARYEMKKVESQLSRYSDLEKYYGGNSKDFHSDEPVVILNGKSASRTLRVYWTKGAQDDKNINASTNLNDLSAKWEGWSSNWKSLKVTSNVAKGYYNVTFKNKATNQLFRVLVIVR